MTRSLLGAPTFGLAGHGLFIAPRCPARAMVTEEGHLLIVHGMIEVARFAPGQAPATEAPTKLDEGVMRFGEHGPMLFLEKAFEEVFAQIDVGLSDSPWSAIGRGFSHDLPAEVVLLGAAPEDSDWWFELHAQGGRDQFIAFEHVGGPVNVRPAPNQELSSVYAFDAVEPDGARRTIHVTELEYTHDGEPWRQAIMQVPFASSVMLVKAQAAETRCEHLFNAVKWVAATLGPLG
jgi:hypothetical protein